MYITDEGRRDVEEGFPRLARRPTRFLNGTVPIDGFLRDNRSIWEGKRFAVTDVDASTAYLRAEGLITGVEVEEFGGPVRANLTAAGPDCVDAGGSVSDYLNRGQAPCTTIATHFHGLVSVGIGEHVQQTQHQGIDVETLSSQQAPP